MPDTARALRRTVAAGLAAISATGAASEGSLGDLAAGTRCYSRTYTAEHLAAHPDQFVTRIDLIPDRTPVPPLAPGTIRLRLDLVQRDDPQRLSAIVDCTGTDGGLDCLQDGDAGRWGVEPIYPDGILLTIDAEQGLLIYGDELVDYLDGEAGDDREFLLRTAACP